MIEIASKIVICLLVAAFIGFLIGFVIGRAGRKSKEGGSHYINPVFKKQGNVYYKPFILSSARPTGADDLTQIEGIDQTTSAALNELGIFHYDQIANWSINNCEWVDNFLDLEGRIEEEAWVKQAQDIIGK